MTETVLKIDGMACGMCEAHVNEVIRNHFDVKKVTSSARKGETRIESEETIPLEKLKDVMAPTGYRILEAESHPLHKKRGLFGRIK